MALLLIIALLIVVAAVAAGGFFGPVGGRGRTTRIIDRTIDNRPMVDEVVEEDVVAPRRVVRRRRY